MDRLAYIESCRPAGRKGYPDALVNAMRVDYNRLKSVEKTGKLWGITRQACWEILNKRRFTRPAKKPRYVAEYKGERFSLDKDGYLRCTSYACRKKGGLRMLHKVVWEEHKGPIPEGHIVVFRDGNRLNCEIDNLECVTRKEFRRRGPKTGNGWTKYRTKIAELEKPWLDALARSAPESEIKKLRAAIDAVPKPKGRDKTQFGKMMKGIWASYTPEQRAARLERVRQGKRKTKMKLKGRHISISQTLSHVTRLSRL